MTHAEINKFLRMLCGHTLGHYETLRATYDIAAALIANGVPGDFVECGVYAGGESAAMALAIVNSIPFGLYEAANNIDATGAAGRQMLTLTNRRVHLFDSFQGMPRCGPEDTEFIAAKKQPGESACSLEGVQTNMKLWGIPSELLVYHPGWFEHTLNWTVGHNIGEIALLRLDGDLYTSTKVCLEHLYPRLVRGGACILDDYPLSGCRKAFHEVVGYPQPIMWHKSM